MNIFKNHLHKAITLLLFLLIFFTSAAQAAVPEITADAAFVFDKTTNQILYEKNATKREYPASLTKIMTCVLALEANTPNRFVNVSPYAAKVVSTRLRAGNRLVMQDLLNALMLISDNGAATALGEAVSQGSITHFSDLMNTKATELGMTGTHFVNAHGMPNPAHYTTAEDITKLLVYAMENPTFKEIVGTKSKDIYFVNPSSRHISLENTNKLLGSYDGMLGGKTGWTRAAGYCFAGAAEREGHELYVVVLHSKDASSRFTETAALLDYGFASLPKQDTEPVNTKKKKRKKK